MNLTPLDEVLDKHFGKAGTPGRDAFESDVKEAIKKAASQQNTTQEQFGEHDIQETPQTSPSAADSAQKTVIINKL